MTFLNRFANRVKDSIYGPAFYEQIDRRPFRSSLKYLALLTLILALIPSFWVGITLGPQALHFLKSAGPTLEENIPSDLVVTVKNGDLSINQPEPYIIPLPPDWKTGTSTVQNLVVIDTRTPASIDSYHAYNTVVLIDKHSYIGEKSNGQIQGGSFTGMNATLSKAIVSPYIDKFQAIVNSLGWLLIVLLALPFVFVIFVGGLIGHFIYLLFAALGIWLIAKIRGVPLGYKKSYQAGMHLITLPAVLSTAFFFTGFQRPFFTFTLVLLVLAFVNLRKPTPMPSVPMSTPPPSQTPGIPN